MTHNVKMISERTDIKFSISYLQGKNVIGLSSKEILNISKKMICNFFACFIFLSLCIMIQGITFMSSKLCYVVIAYYNKHFCARSSGM